MSALLELPPLALYIHIPWCLQKCPYCDFNSHAVIGELDESSYINALLRDLDSYLPQVADRELISIFIGGGTPSLFSCEAISRLLQGVRKRLNCASDIEITMEANPGAVDREHFQAYRQAGVNRLSIGAQSFDSEQLQILGRIHGPEEIATAVNAARAAGFDNLNLDIMYGLPGQTIEAAEADITQAISLQPQHISYYQLTIEPNTRLYTAPPSTPDDELLMDIEDKGRKLLDRAGYQQYEVSAFARDGYECRHNRNYWEFGDYLGIGAGAHGKLTDLNSGTISRMRKPKSPDSYLAPAQLINPHDETVEPKDLILEFMLNALRLKQGFHPGLLQQRTGVELSMIESGLAEAEKRGLLKISENLICPTSKGMQFLNELVAMFMSD
jgi:oxygen-independent coproporphyrinogen-3 oxidase